LDVPSLRLRVSLIANMKQKRVVAGFPDAAVAKLLTQSAYVADTKLVRVSESLNTAMMATELNYDMAWTERVYNHVVERLGSDVDIHALEQQFNFEFAPRCVGDRILDPFSSRDVVRNIQASFGNLLKEIERVSSALPGIDPLQYQDGTEVAGAVNLFYNRLSPLLSNRATDHAMLSRTTAVVCNEIASDACAKAVLRTQKQQAGLRALQRLCAAAVEHRDVEEVVESGAHLIAEMLYAPPESFVNEMQRLAVPISELAFFLQPFASTVPICGAARSISIARWANAYAGHVETVCVGVLHELRCLEHADCSAVVWHGVGVWASNDERTKLATATGGLSCVAPCPRAVHAHGCDNMVVVALRTSQRTALRSVRLARIVYELVHSGALRPWCVRADGLLPMISRFSSEASVQLHFVQTQLEAQIAEDEECSHADDDDVADEPTSDNVADEPTSSVEVPVVPMRLGNQSFDIHESILVSSQVPQSLQRDYLILLVVYIFVAERIVSNTASKTHVSVAAVIDKLCAIAKSGHVGGMIRCATRVSLQQSTAHVFNKLVSMTQRLAIQNREPCGDDDLVYGRLPTWCVGGKGINANEIGTRRLKEFLVHAIECMRSDGERFARVWYPSRSSKCHARRKCDTGRS